MAASPNSGAGCQRSGWAGMMAMVCLSRPPPTGDEMTTMMMPPRIGNGKWRCRRSARQYRLVFDVVPPPEIRIRPNARSRADHDRGITTFYLSLTSVWFPLSISRVEFINCQTNHELPQTSPRSRRTKAQHVGISFIPECYA